MAFTEALSLADIARLAKVQRPVVSVWRTRSRDSARPFPEPKFQRNSQDYFDLGQVVTWLQETGRGNNPHAAEDAAAFSIETRMAFEEVSALLALRALSDQPLTGMDADELLDLADDIDPDDEFCYSEIEQLGDRIMPLAGYCDRLVDASYGAVPAFEFLLTDRFRLAHPPLSQTALDHDALQLLATAALEISGRPRVFAEATPVGSDLLVAVAELLGESTDGTFLLAEMPRKGSDLSRLATRRIVVLTALRDNLSSALPHSAPPGVVYLAQYPGPGAPDMDEVSILQAIDDLVLQLGPTDRAVIIAPASLLIDRLDSAHLEGTRSATLRSGRVRAAIRLPQGLMVSKPRQAMGLWALGPEPKSVPLGERGVMVADLSEYTLDEAVVGDLATDLAASLGGPETIHKHAFRFAKLVRTSSLLASASGLIPRAARHQQGIPPRPDTAAESLIRLENAVESANASAIARPALGFDVVSRSAGQSADPYRTLASLHEDGSIRTLPGTRIDDADLSRVGDSGISVWTAQTLDSSGTSERMDPMLLAAHYPRAILTEPGDIVFRTGPTPAAVVDSHGASAVQYPARILRVSKNSGTGLLPTVLAAEMAASKPGPWRRWSVRTVPPDQVDTLAEALTVIHREREAAEERLKRLADVETQLMNGLIMGNLEMMRSMNSMEGRP
ncbi:hypothetical protein OK351_09035 [Glutamicibacter sp. MNS18]|uniref:hypothetical protein n=1 Tax=Glutamicibacter sp. MNS18 TaxID=2989817 RepID=UPI0022362D02|nr:hypothetical protein [Glutamicibacter sp. MNS18]MCW4465649.1 hypothetical protein [Glutamicibacter sp. MNS18]